MANRPVFISKNEHPFFEKVDIEFKFYSGFNISQKQKNIRSLHEAFKEKFKNSSGYEQNILEVSSKSLIDIGIKLSAFNLFRKIGESNVSVECIFQASKKFSNGGPYLDLLNSTSREAKKDERIKNSGQLQNFIFQNKIFPIEPKTFFYDWIYINTLHNYNQQLAKDVMKYDVFTDIEFNPNKSINCQAEALAIYIGLIKAGKIDYALKNSDNFLEVVYDKYQTILF